jgi:hypothetical protein
LEAELEEGSVGILEAVLEEEEEEREELKVDEEEEEEGRTEEEEEGMERVLASPSIMAQGRDSSMALSICKAVC